MRTEPDRTTLRWSALGLLASMQFLLVVDLTVVNIALPRIGEELGFSASGEEQPLPSDTRLKVVQMVRRASG